MGNRRIHLVNWQTVTLPVLRGGLGIRSCRGMNTTFFTEIGLAFSHSGGCLVVILRGIVSHASLLQRNLYTTVSNGQVTSF